MKEQRFNTMKYSVTSFQYQGARIYNNLPVEIKQCETSKDFKNVIKKWDGPKCQCGFYILCQNRISK